MYSILVYLISLSTIIIHKQGQSFSPLLRFSFLPLEPPVRRKKKVHVCRNRLINLNIFISTNLPQTVNHTYTKPEAVFISNSAFVNSFSVSVTFSLAFTHVTSVLISGPTKRTIPSTTHWRTA